MAFDDDERYDLDDAFNSYREKEDKESFGVPGRNLVGLMYLASVMLPLAAGMEKGVNDAQENQSGLELVVLFCGISALLVTGAKAYQGGTKETPKDPLMRKLQGMQWSWKEAMKEAVKGAKLGTLGSAGLGLAGYVLGRMLGKV